MEKAAIKIAPSILSADFGRLQQDIDEAERAGADYIHVDVMDGRFVPNITIGPPVVKALRRCTSVPLDVHLMITHPETYVEEFAKAGADMITVHVEASTHLNRTLNRIRELGKKAGVALNPSTPLVALEESLDDVDLVLIMSVNPGFGGQRFIEGSLVKIRRCAEMIGGRSIELAVDGGISAGNARAVAEAGADVLVAGYAIFGEGDISENLKAIKDACL